MTTNFDVADMMARDVTRCGQQQSLSMLIDEMGIKAVMSHPAIRAAVAEALVLADEDKARAVAEEREAGAVRAAIFWEGVATRFRLAGNGLVAHEIGKAIVEMQAAIRSRGEGERDVRNP